jgi:tripartite-type tricarboxylate transporter receptor subunit TctC
VVKEYPPKTKAGKALMNDLISFESTSSPYLFLAAPPNVPPQYILALRMAFEWAMKQPASQQLFLTNNIVPGYFQGTAIVPYVDKTLKKYVPIFQRYANSPVSQITGKA